MSALGVRRAGEAITSMRQPLIGVGDLTPNLNRVDAAEDSRVDGPDAYTAVDIVDASTTISKGGKQLEGMAMTVSPSQTQTISEPPSRLSTLFTRDSLADPFYHSPYYSLIRGKAELDDLSYLPGGDLRPLARKPVISPLSLPSVESFANGNDGVAAGEPPLPFTLTHRSLLIMATDEIDFTTKMRIMGQAFKLSSTDTERHASTWQADRYRMSMHKSELLRQLFAIEQNPYYHAKAFTSPELYHQWMRDTSLQLHNQLLGISVRMQKQSLSAIAQVGNVVKGVGKGLMKTVGFGGTFHVDETSMDMFFDDIKSQTPVAAKPQMDVHRHYVRLVWALYQHEVQHNISQHARVRDTERSIWPYDMAPMSSTYSTILDAFANVYSIGAVFRAIVQLQFLSLHLHSSPQYFNMVAMAFNQLQALQSTTVWTKGEMARHVSLAEDHFQWASRCVVRYQEVYALTSIPRILKSVENISNHRSRSSSVITPASGLPTAEIGLRECVLTLRVCWSTILKHDRAHPGPRSAMEQKAIAAGAGAGGAGQLPPEPLDRTGLVDWLRPRVRSVLERLYPDVISTGAGDESGIFLSHQQLMDTLERVRVEIVSDRKMSEIYFDDELRFMRQLSVETYVGRLWNDAKMFVQSMGELDVESASNLYILMRDAYQKMSGHITGHDVFMEELRSWFGPLIDRWLDQLELNLDKEFHKSGMVNDMQHTFTRIDQLSDQIRSRPCSVAQIQRFARMLKAIIKDCIGRVNANVVSLLSSFNGTSRMSRELITAINELHSCSLKLDASMARLLADLPAAERDATRQREMNIVYSSLGSAANRIVHLMIPHIAPSFVAVLQKDPPVFMSMDDIQTRCESVWKYLAGHLNVMSADPQTKGIPLAAEFLSWFGVLLLGGVYRVLEEEIVQDSRVKIGKKPKSEKFLRKPQLNRIGHMIQLLKELLGAFHISLPTVPSSVTAPSAVSSPTAPTSAAKMAAGGAQSLGVPLHLMAALLHLYRIEQLFTIISEPTPVLIEQWNSYPDAKVVNNADIALAHAIDDEKLRGFPPAAGFAAAHADSLATATTTTSPAPVPSLVMSNSFSSYGGLSGESKDEKRMDMAGSMFGLTTVPPTSSLQRQDTRRPLDVSSISPSLVQGVVGGMPVFTSEVTDIPLLSLSHRTARVRITRDLLVVALQTRARFDDDSAAQVFVKQFDAKGNLLKAGASAAAVTPHRRQPSSAASLSPQHPGGALHSGMSMLSPGAGNVFVSPQGSPAGTPSNAATNAAYPTNAATDGGKKRGVFGRLFGRKDKDGKVDGHQPASAAAHPPTSPQ